MAAAAIISSVLNISKHFLGKCRDERILEIGTDDPRSFFAIYPKSKKKKPTAGGLTRPGPRSTFILPKWNNQIAACSAGAGFRRAGWAQREEIFSRIHATRMARDDVFRPVS
jgi:hypothetical protein